MAKRVLQWGLLSTAHINRKLIPSLRKSQRNQLLGIASRSQERADAYAREWGIPKAYHSYEAMLADPAIDVIYISLPNSLHAEWTIRACQAGKHVLCEKPLAMSVEEVYAMEDVAQKAGVIVAEAFMYRHHPQTHKVKELVDSGALGELRLVRGSFTFLLKSPENIRLTPDLGGGSIWDVGCYPISYARYVIGAEPVEVWGTQLTGPSGVDLFFAGQMRFPRGVIAQFDCGFNANSRTIVEIVGGEASLSILHPFTPGVREHLLLSYGDRVERISVRGSELYRGEVEDMADAILEGKTPRISLAHSRNNVNVIVSLLRSAREGCAVNISKTE